MIIVMFIVVYTTIIRSESFPVRKKILKNSRKRLLEVFRAAKREKVGKFPDSFTDLYASIQVHTLTNFIPYPNIRATNGWSAEINEKYYRLRQQLLGRGV